VGSEKVVCWNTKASISLKRVKIEEKLPWGPTGSHQRSFEWYHPQLPTVVNPPTDPTKEPIELAGSL